MADRFHLAQTNIGRTVGPIDAAELADFVALLPSVNALAEATPGFVWRLQSEQGDATDILIEADDPLVILNLTVWESRDALWEFVYRTRHMDVLRRRREWFERHVEAHMCLWWIPAGTIPTIDEALERLAAIRRDGPTPFAFTFREPFEPDGSRAGRPGAPSFQVAGA